MTSPTITYGHAPGTMDDCDSKTGWTEKTTPTLPVVITSDGDVFTFTCSPTAVGQDVYIEKDVTDAGSSTYPSFLVRYKTDEASSGCGAKVVLVFEEVNPLVFYEDDEGIWSAYQTGSGSYGITLSEETTIVKKGTSSLKAVVGAGSYENVGYFYNFGSQQDWTGKEFACFWFYGSNSSETVRFRVEDWDDDYVYWDVVDNWSGWKRLVFPFDNPDGSSGTFELSKVKGITVYWEAVGAAFTCYQDRIVLDHGCSQTILSKSYSTTWTEASETVTSARTVDKIWLYAESDATTGTDYVYYDFVLLHKGTFTFPYVSLGGRSGGLRITFPNKVTTQEISGRDGDWDDQEGISNPLITLEGEIEAGTETWGNTVKYGEYLFEIWLHARTDPWQWFTSDMINCQVTLPPNPLELAMIPAAPPSNVQRTWVFRVKHYKLSSADADVWSGITDWLGAQ